METISKSLLPLYSLDYNLVRTYEHPDLKSQKNSDDAKINYLTCSPDKKLVVCGYISGEIIVFDYLTGETVKIIKAHNDKVLHIEIGNAGKLMLTAGADGKINMFKTEDFSYIGEIIHPDHRNSITVNEIRFTLISQDAQQIYFGADSGCIFKCNKSNNYMPELVCHPNSMYPPEPYFITCGIFSHDKKYIVFGSGYSLKFFNLKTQSVDKITGRTKHYINDVICHPHNNDLIVTWSQDGTITYWNLKTNKPLMYYTAGRDRSHLAFNYSGKFLASGSNGNNALVWDSETKHLLVTITDKYTNDGSKKAHTGEIKSLLFTEEDHLLTGSYDGTAKLWKLN